MGVEPQYPGEARGKLCWGERLCPAETLMEQALVTGRRACPLSCSCWARPGSFSQLYFTGQSHNSKLLGSLRVSNRKASVHKVYPSSLSPAGILKRLQGLKRSWRTHAALGSFCFLDVSLAGRSLPSCEGAQCEHLWLPCWSHGTRDSAPHEGTGHLAQLHNSPWGSWSTVTSEGPERASEHPLLPPPPQGPLPHRPSALDRGGGGVFFILILKAKVAR